MTTYQISSSKQAEQFAGTIADAARRADAIDADLRPAFGVAVYSLTDGAVLYSTEERTEAAWWHWHDADSSRWSYESEDADARCAAWVADRDNTDGPDWYLAQ